MTTYLDSKLNKESKMKIKGKYFYWFYFKGQFDKLDALNELSGKYIRADKMYRLCSTHDTPSLKKYIKQASIILCYVELDEKNVLHYYV